MIKPPHDGRGLIERQIEAQVHGLNELVTDYLNMVSLANKAAAEAKVRDLMRAHPVLQVLLKLPPVPKP